MRSLWKLAHLQGFNNRVDKTCELINKLPQDKSLFPQLCPQDGVSNHTGVAWLVFMPLELLCPHNVTQDGEQPGRQGGAFSQSLHLSAAHCSHLQKASRIRASCSTELQAWKTYVHMLWGSSSAVYLLKSIKRQNPCGVAAAIPRGCWWFSHRRTKEFKTQKT